MTRLMIRPIASLCLVAASAAFITACGPQPSPPAASAAPQPAAAAAPSGPVAPRFEVDPFWPKPLPNHWVLGSAIGVSVDSRDHVWIIHRHQSLNLETEASAGKNAPAGECCMVGAATSSSSTPQATS